MKQYTIQFPCANFSSVQIPEGTVLSESLTPENSPVLFGCRSGICGTCLVEIHDLDGALPPPTWAELESLEIYAPDNPKARLACQIQLTSSILLRKIDSV